MSKILTAILKILLYTGIFSTTLPLVFFLLFKINNKQKALRVIFFYVLYCVINEGLSFYLQSINSENFVYLLYTFTIVEYSFFCYFIYIILPKTFIKKIVPFLWISFVLLSLIDIIYISKERDFNSFATGIESIIILLLCSYYLFSQIRSSNSLVIYSTFNFWVVIAFLIFFSGTFFVYLLTNKMSRDPSFQTLYFIINISFNILKNILLCVAMTMRLQDTVIQQKTIVPDLDHGLFTEPKK